MLQALANKLGVAVTHLWGAICHQQVVEGVVAFILCGIFISLALVLLVIIKRNNLDETPFILSVCGIIIFIIAFIFALCFGVLHVMSPEYYAYKEIVSDITNN
jgi:flagellar biogenesis protein FliO